MTEVTFDNFYEEVKFYCKAQVRKADGLGLIVSDVESDAAKAWIAYAEAKGWAHRAKMWKQMLKQGCKLTMPCANPSVFDPSYRAPHVPRTEVREMNEDVDSRRSIGQQIRDVVAKSRPRDKRRPDNEIEEPPMTPAEIEAGLKAREKANPAKISPRLADHLGIRPPAQDAAE